MKENQPPAPEFLAKKKGFKPASFIPGWYLCEYALLRAAAAVLNALPLGLASAAARAAGSVIFRLARKRSRIALYNLDIAFGPAKSAAEKRRIAEKSFQHLALSLVELVRIPKLLREAEKRFEIEHFEYCEQAFAHGRGFVSPISHLGSWELLGFGPFLRKFECSVIGKSLRNPYIYEWVEGLRGATTLKHLDKNRALKTVFSELRKNHAVAILIDQWAGPDGLWIDFFGRKTSTTSIPVKFAEKTGCHLVPSFCIRTGTGKFKILFKPNVEVNFDEPDWEVKTTEKLNRILEELILLHPEQWSWTHRRWKEKPPGMLETPVQSSRPDKILKNS